MRWCLKKTSPAGSQHLLANVSEQARESSKLVFGDQHFIIVGNPTQVWIPAQFNPYPFFFDTSEDALSWVKDRQSQEFFFQAVANSIQVGNQLRFIHKPTMVQISISRAPAIMTKITTYEAVRVP